MNGTDDHFLLLNAQIRIEKEMEYVRWYKEIPFIRFPASWEVKIVPPFRGAVVRFRVRNARGKEISVYLDCYDNLGLYGAPYWEIYPNAEGDVSRYPMRDVDGLLDGIKRSFRRRS